MLPVRHLDSSASLCRWQRASLWWNNGANCPRWTGDQTSAFDSIWRCFLRCEAIYAIVNAIGEKMGDRGINTKECFENLVLPNSVFSYINCIVAFSCSMWYGWMWNDMTGGVTQLQQVCRWGVSWNFPQSHWHCSSFETSQLRKVDELKHPKDRWKWMEMDTNGVMLNLFVSWEFYSFVSSTIFSQISFHRGNPSLKWGITFQPRHQRHPTELPCDTGNQHPP